MAQETRVYDYKIQVWGILFLSACCLLFAVGFGFLSATNQDGDRFFYQVLTGGFVLAAGLMVYICIKQRKKSHSIVLTPEAITLPSRPLWGRTITIPLTTITHVEMVSNRAIAFISIRHKKGAVAIPEMQVESKAVYKELFTRLSSSLSNPNRRPC